MTYTGGGVRDMAKFEKSMRSFVGLAPQCGGTDIDRYIERRGKLLFLEGKTWRHDGIRVPIGQHIAFMALAQLEPVTFWLVGEPSGANEEDARWHVMPFGRVAPLFEREGSAFYPASLFRNITKHELEQMVLAWWGVASLS